jgi:NSS family neurotransmitter:Na+ symporter
MSVDRGQFSSKLGFILAAAGSAVGLGNLAAFPVSAAKNGGAAFLIIYLTFVAFVAFPVMVAEMTMGRKAKLNPVGAFDELSGKEPIWRKLGSLAVITPFMISVFYLVITVWVFAYFLLILTGDLSLMAEGSYFGKFIASPSFFYYTIIVILIILGILYGGVKEGIEKTAKILMPSLAIMMLLLVIFVLTLDNAFKGLEFYLLPKWELVDGKIINSALSQAFFSLSLGMGILITYGSYIRKEDDIVDSAKLVAISDTAIAFFAGLLILPAIFSFNPSIEAKELSESSVGLIFAFLPKVFMSMESTIGYFGASFVAATFFLLVFFAALTSLVSLVEVPTAYFVDEKKYSRKKSLTIIGVLMAVISSIAALSFGMNETFTSFVSYAGKSKSFFDVIEDTFYLTILPFMGFLASVFTVYKWKTTEMFKELEIGRKSDSPNYFMEKYIKFSLGTFIPIILFFIFINTVLSVYFNIDLLGVILG